MTPGQRVLVDDVMAYYCTVRIPERVRHLVRLEWAVRGNSVTLIERRPPFRGKGEWTSFDVAQFRLLPGTGQWMLYFRDRTHRWHLHEPVRAVARLETLLKTVDRDPTQLFWG